MLASLFLRLPAMVMGCCSMYGDSTLFLQFKVGSFSLPNGIVSLGQFHVTIQSFAHLPPHYSFSCTLFFLLLLSFSFLPINSPLQTTNSRSRFTLIPHTH